jgi:microcin C transport system substrate-binding protein
MALKTSLRSSIMTLVFLVSVISLGTQAGPVSALPASAKQAPAPEIAPKSDTASKQMQHRKHALSLIGEPNYPADFKHFNFVNPSAPKGGRVRLGANGSYDNLNLFTSRGVTPNGLGLIYDSLMDQSLDQPSTSYCLLCEWVAYPEDFSSVTFKLRENARWHDGKPVTVDDVIFSFNTFIKLHPFYKFYYKNVTSAKKTGPHKVTFRFNVKNNREMPQIMGDLTVLPKHYWEDTDAHYVPRDPSKSTLAPPLGSGPYKIAKMKRGATMTFERVKDYWGRDLPANTGRYNFDEIHYTYYHDETVALEAFKSGLLDYRQETSSKRWATAYNFPAFNKGQIKKQMISLKNAEPMQAFVLNTRRTKFKDPRVRRAFTLAFNFEWANKNLFYGQYKRTSSYFENTELASSGLPSGKELEILSEIKDLLPPEVFTKPYKLPANQTSRDFRKNLHRAAKLLDSAGWKIKNGIRVHEKTGETLKAELLLVSPSFERIVTPYQKALKKIGILTNIRMNDTSQYTRRMREFDFDIVIATFRQSQSPGNEQRNYWGSAAADKKGSRNLIGIKDKGIDKLIDRIIFAKSRAELVAATRALDRVLLWRHYLVPQWYSPYDRIVYWNKFGQPQTLPSQNVGFIATWWYDKKAADTLAKTEG